MRLPVFEIRRGFDLVKNAHLRFEPENSSASLRFDFRPGRKEADPQQRRGGNQKANDMKSNLYDPFNPIRFRLTTQK